MAAFTRYARALDASGGAISVREALASINRTLDKTLAKQEGDFDPDTCWGLAWLEQSGFGEGDFGSAETFSKARNTSISGMAEAGVLRSGAGRARLLASDELPGDWDLEGESRCTAWEAVHHHLRPEEPPPEGIGLQRPSAKLERDFGVGPTVGGGT